MVSERLKVMRQQFDLTFKNVHRMDFLPMDHRSYCKDMRMNPMEQDLSTNLYGPHKFVYIDLETTGLSKSAEICQIAAKYNDESFSEYILPHYQIDSSASAVNGLTLKENVLYKNNIPVHTLSLIQCFLKFLDFIKCVGGRIILVGHNILKFDSYYILRDVKSFDLEDQFTANVYGILDTLPLFKSLLPSRKSYKLTDLSRDLLNDNCAGAHEAMYDVQLLQKVIEVLNVNSETLLKNSVPLNIYLEKKAADENRKKSILSFEPCRNVLTIYMINKMVKAELNLSILADRYRSSGEEGIELLMSQDVDGKPRITKNKSIILALTNFLKSYTN